MHRQLEMPVHNSSVHFWHCLLELHVENYTLECTCRYVHFLYLNEMDCWPNDCGGRAQSLNGSVPLHSRGHANDDCVNILHTILAATTLNHTVPALQSAQKNPLPEYHVSWRKLEYTQRYVWKTLLVAWESFYRSFCCWGANKPACSEWISRQ